LAVGCGWLRLVAVGFAIAAWLLVMLARSSNSKDRAALFYGSTLLSCLLAIASAITMLWGPWRNGMDPTHHVYSAIVCILVLWTTVHVGVGVMMLIVGGLS
jgi:cytochrome c oxidase subunit I+III